LRILLGATNEGARLDLQPLILAAQIDLAEEQRVEAVGARTRAALFVLAAATLGAASLADEQREALAELGALSAADPASPERTALQPIVARLGAKLQPTVAPLLIWVVLAARKKKSGSLLEGFAENLRAWNVARRAAQGNLRIRC
jgi:hypothetical protein